MNPSSDAIRQMLTEAKTIAVVGASSKSNRPSNGVMQALLSHGYEVYPVNPREEEILGQRCYASLTEVPVAIDIVDVFRRVEETPAVADEAVAVGAKVLWLQLGISSEEAEARARRGGLEVVMDLCIAPTLYRLGVPRKSQD